MTDVHGATVIPPERLTFTPPSRGDPSRGYAPLGVAAVESREPLEEETFVTIEGTATLVLGDPGEGVELPQGTIVIVAPGTPLQLVNAGEADCVVLVVGAPPTIGDAEYPDDAAPL